MLPDALMKLLDKWIAVQRPNVYNEYLFVKTILPATDDNADNDIIGHVNEDTIDLCVSYDNGTQSNSIITAKYLVESFLSSICDVVSVFQQCVDWFIMWQFHVIGTNSGKILL